MIFRVVQDNQLSGEIPNEWKASLSKLFTYSIHLNLNLNYSLLGLFALLWVKIILKSLMIYQRNGGRLVNFKILSLLQILISL